MIVSAGGREGTHFSALNEYDLRYMVGHLIAAARERKKRLGIEASRDVRLLIKLLADPAFALTQADVIGAEATVADFVSGHDAVRIVLPPEARGLSRAFVTAAIVSSVSGKAVLTPDALNALLTYRTDTPVYGELLEFATDEKLIAKIVPDASDRSWLLRAFLHNAATRCRRLGGRNNIDRAREMLSRARDVGLGIAATHGSEDMRSESVLSSIFYDGRVDADEFRALLDEALEYFTEAAGESPHAERWVMNVHAHLFDLACLAADTHRADAEFAILQ